MALALLAEAIGADSAALAILVGGAALAALALDALRLSNEAVARWFFTRFRRVASPREETRIASSTWFLVGALFVLLAAPGELFRPAILVLALADPAAGVVGRLWGGCPLGSGSWIGSLAFLGVGVGVLAPQVGFVQAGVGAAAAAVAEAFSGRLDDNFVVPAATALALWAAGAVQ